MQEPTLFSRIISGEIPSHKIYEDSQTLAFMDIHPVADGHLLVISKTQVEFVWDLNSSDYTALMATVQKVALRLRDVIGTPYVGEMVVGTDVPHAHVHVIPFTETSQLKRTLDSSTAEPDHEALAKLAEKLSFS
jgi:histidine triad (HIT) family protein